MNISNMVYYQPVKKTMMLKINLKKTMLDTIINHAKLDII